MDNTPEPVDKHETPDPDEGARAGDAVPEKDAEDADKPTFEEAFSRLEAVVRRLEGEEVTLDQSLKLFEEGVGLARLCASQLDAAEGKMRVLLDSDGEKDVDEDDLNDWSS